MQTKICKKCGEELPLTAEYFPTRKNSKDGFRNECKKCISEYKRQNRKENIEIITIKRKERYEKNKEVELNRNKKYRDLNKEILKQWFKKHYEENKKIISEKHKLYKKRNKDRINIINQKRRSIKKQLPNTLTLKQ